MVYHMKTTIDIPDELMLRAKKHAIDLRRPFRELVIEGLRARLDAGPLPAKSGADLKVRWVCHEGGLPLGMDLTNREAMSQWLREPR